MAEPDILDAGPANPNKPLVNENPHMFGAAYFSVVNFLESYGWLVLFSIVLVLVVWTNIKDSLRKFLGHRKRTYDVTDSLTSDQIMSRMEGMERARHHMQERYDAQVRERAEKLKEREEEKREQKISDHDALKSGKSQSSTQNKLNMKSDSEQTPTVIKRNKNQRSMRDNDYSPLGGGAGPGSSRWRPTPNRPSAGG